MFFPTGAYNRFVGQKFKVPAIPQGWELWLQITTSPLFPGDRGCGNKYLVHKNTSLTLITLLSSPLYPQDLDFQFFYELLKIYPQLYYMCKILYICFSALFTSQWVQHRMVLVVNVFVFLFFCLVIAMSDLVCIVEAIHGPYVNC